MSHLSVACLDQHLDVAHPDHPTLRALALQPCGIPPRGSCKWWPWHGGLLLQRAVGERCTYHIGVVHMSGHQRLVQCVELRCAAAFVAQHLYCHCATPPGRCRNQQAGYQLFVRLVLLAAARGFTRRPSSKSPMAGGPAQRHCRIWRHTTRAGGPPHPCRHGQSCRVRSAPPAPGRPARCCAAAAGPAEYTAMTRA